MSNGVEGDQDLLPDAPGLAHPDPDSIVRQAFEAQQADFMRQLHERLTAIEALIETKLAQQEVMKQRARGAPAIVENLKHTFSAILAADELNRSQGVQPQLGRMSGLLTDARDSLRAVLIALGVQPQELVP